jgi:hypothetical protein
MFYRHSQSHHICSTSIYSVFKKRCHFLNIFFLYVILPQSERAARERKGEKGQMARESFHLVDPKPDTMGLGRHPQIGSCISKALPPQQT